jgi:hypothetical protein
MRTAASCLRAAMKLIADMDGMEHVMGGDCCMPRTCRRCGGRQHFQGIYGGYLELCEQCEAGQWTEPTQRHSEEP